MQNKNKTNFSFKAIIALAVVVLNMALFMGVAGAQDVFVDKTCNTKYIVDNISKCEGIVELKSAIKCTDNLELQADVECKSFEQYIKILKSSAASKFPEHVTKINKCYDDEFTDAKLKECKTNDAKVIQKCIEDAFKANNVATKACNDTKTTSDTKCTEQVSKFRTDLCGASPNKVDTDPTQKIFNDCIIRNSTSIGNLRASCDTSVKTAFVSCTSTITTTYSTKIKECANEDVRKTKDQECFDKVIADNKILQKCLPVCGNGGDPLAEYGEECDDGNVINGDGCNSVCKNEICGNGITDGKDEECDLGADKNGKPGEYCNAECKYTDKIDKFDVSRYLKIAEGQTYLEANSSEDQKISLQRGLVFFILKAIDFMTKIIGSFALLIIIAGGILLMVSSGNSGMQQKGKRMILYAIIGLAIAFTSLVIVTFVQSLFYTT